MHSTELLLTLLAFKFFLIEMGMPLFKSRGPERDQIVRDTELSGPIPQEWCKYWPQPAGSQGIWSTSLSMCISTSIQALQLGNTNFDEMCCSTAYRT